MDKLHEQYHFMEYTTAKIESILFIYNIYIYTVYTYSK